jgi:hypothetical protein
MELTYQLRKRGDLRQIDEIAAIAIKEWLSRNFSRPAGTGYQWKDLFLPDGTSLRLRYRGIFHYADVVGDELVYEGRSLSPRAWTTEICGTVRNAWRDIWIRRNYNEPWTQASAWRACEVANPRRPGIDRRLIARRCTD